MRIKLSNFGSSQLAPVVNDYTKRDDSPEQKSSMPVLWDITGLCKIEDTLDQRASEISIRGKCGLPARQGSPPKTELTSC